MHLSAIAPAFVMLSILHMQHSDPEASNASRAVAHDIK